MNVNCFEVSGFNGKILFLYFFKYMYVFRFESIWSTLPLALLCLINYILRFFRKLNLYCERLFIHVMLKILYVAIVTNVCRISFNWRIPSLNGEVLNSYVASIKKNGYQKKHCCTAQYELNNARCRCALALSYNAEPWIFGDNEA